MLVASPLLGLFCLLLVVSLFSGPSLAWARFTCRADVDRTSAVTGGTVTLTVTAEGNISGSIDFQLPEIPSAMVSGTSYSRSQVYSNGSSKVTVAKIFYLTVLATKELEIGPVVVSDGQGSCETEPIKITITDLNRSIPPAVSGNRMPRPNARGSQEQSTSSAAGGQPGDDIFITLDVDQDTAWVNQQIILTFRYFHRVNPWNQPQFVPPRTPGFWRENLGQQQEYRKTVGGRAYNVTEIKYAVFPTTAGQLTIEPAELSFPDQGLDRFFSSRRRRGPRTLHSDPITIEVKALPKEKPDDFSGLVAREVRLSATTNLKTVPRGEPVDFKIQLISDGFLKGFEGVKMPPVPDARIHDAGDDFRTNAEQNRLWGQVTQEKVIVPAQDGDLRLPQVSLNWFNVRTGRFVTSSAGAGTIIVTPSDHPFEEQEDSGFLRSEVSRLGQDLVFIHKVPEEVHTGGRVLVKTPWWWGGLILPLIFLGLGKFYLLRRLSDPVVLRKQRALVRALALLESNQEGEGFLNSERMSRAISGFVADCENVPGASVGAAEVQTFCLERNCPEEGKRLLQIMAECDATRYGKENQQGISPSGLSEIKSILTELDRRGRKVPARSSGSSTGTLLPILFLVLGLVAGGNQVSAAVDPARLMAEGNQAYTEGKVKQALELYQQAEVLGARDPDLFFNLGNAHARRGELGHAVVNYLRAQRLAPNDQDIKDNLAWVRGNIEDLELNDSELPLFIAQMVGIVFALTLNQWSLGLLVGVWALCALVVLRWKFGKSSDFWRRLLLVGISGVVLLAAIVIWRWRIEEVRQTAVVIVEEVAVRSGPDETFPVQFMVHDGLTVQLQEQRKQWVRISLGGESLGWMPLPSVERVRRVNQRPVSGP